MTLRARLLVGYGYLVALLVLVAGSAMVGFLGLSAGVQEVIEDNFRSVEASMTMIDALERQDSITLAALIEGQVDRDALEEQEGAFREALEIASSNVTEPEEPEILDSIRQRHGTWREARDLLVEEQPERPLAAYEQSVFPAFLETKGAVLELLAVKQIGMIQADRSAREAAIRSGTWIGFLVVVALVSLVLLSRVLQQQILRRLEELREGVQSIRAGEYRRLRQEGDDELALIARGVNGLLDGYQELEGRARGRFAQERRLVLGLLRACGEGALLFGLSGELLAADTDPGELEGLVEDWIGEKGRDLARKAEPVRQTLSYGGGEVTVSLLIAPGDRPVGWLVRAG